MERKTNKTVIKKIYLFEHRLYRFTIGALIANHFLEYMPHNDAPTTQMNDVTWTNGLSGIRAAFTVCLWRQTICVLQGA